MLHREFVANNIPIFPLWPILPTGECGCPYDGCKAAGKHPRTSNWQHTPVWSDEQLDAMEDSGQLDTGYGVLVSGRLLVVDVDARNGGVDSFERLLDDIPSLYHAGLVVETGSGGGSRHLYYRLDDDQALVQHLEDYPGVDFKSTGYVVGPGSWHVSGNRYEVQRGHIEEIDLPPDDLIDLLAKPDRHRADLHGSTVDVSEDEIREMLSYIDPDIDHDTWVYIGMAIHETTAGSGMGLWQEWSKQGDKYTGPREIEARWHSFGKQSGGRVTLGTLVHHAKEGGWSRPVTFEPDVWLEPDPVEDNDPLDVSDVDVLRPPGFVGEITQWINSRSRYPRERLAVAAALATVSSVAGMRYRDELDGITPNVFLFGVAASATGKESVLKSCKELLKAGGVTPAVHGAIKSEQEVYRNLVRHQAAIYVIDEFGEHLAKLANARSKGNTAYLEGVIGTLMSLFTKADSFALITGDLKDKLKKELQSTVNGIVDDHGEEPADEQVAQLLQRTREKLDGVDRGLKNPYLNVIGLTTPGRFDELMTYDMAANGFIGRAIIFREANDNPEGKPRGSINRDPVPDDMSAVLSNLYAPGYSEGALPNEVCRVGRVCSVATTDEAGELLDEIQRRFWEQAQNHADSTGLTPIPRRGYELTAKVSMILAIPSGLRTEQHVRWAYALVQRDIDNKIHLAGADAAPNEGEQLANKIMSLVDVDHGMTIGRLRSRCRQWSKKQVDAICAQLAEAGHLTEETTAASNSGGRTTTRYFLSG